MAKSIAHWVRSLSGARGNAYGAVERFVTSGDVAQAVKLARAIEVGSGCEAPAAEVERLYDHVVDALAHASTPEAALAALELGLSDRRPMARRPTPDAPGPAVVRPYVPSPRRPDGVERALGMRLTTGHPATTLLLILADDATPPHWEDTLACWVQERVVRGDTLDGEPAVLRLWARLRARSHPFADLPLRPLEPEAELAGWLPRPRLNGSSGPLLPSGVGRGAPQGPPGLDEPLVYTELPVADDAGAVVSGWEEASNGRSEVRRFRLERPPGVPTVTAALLVSLPLECVHGLGVEDVTVAPGSLATVAGYLFAASANGGAYGGMRGPAYARLELWRTVAGLLGVGPTEAGRLDVEAVASLAATWRWTSFDAGGRWFDHVAWDLGVVGLSPDGREVVVLAATDQD